MLWTGLETDEVRHAGVVRKLAQIITARPERFRAGRSLNPVGIQSFIAYVESVRERVAAASFTADQLLIVVRDIENSLIELRVSEIVRSDDIEYNTLAAEILAQSFHHRQAVVSRIGK